MTFMNPLHTCRGLILAAFAVLAACATPTPYQPDLPGQRVSGGFSEERLADNRYRVTFTGNCFTSRERVEGYLLYRSAELTLQKQYDWFVIADRLVERDARTFEEYNYSPYWGSAYGYWRPYWDYYDPRIGWRRWHPGLREPFWADRVTLRTVEQFTAHAEIVMHRGAVPGNEERAFVARQVIADLESTIERPAERGTC
ncbi:CC0125/CC1285 family lipoprotein [Aurantiacibacter marinus]|uniref:Lipoprotein n=1 Tax=Aurantiacibacter marinus TaxID=874156 RepID=A0A0H0XKA7_9SPHN|nr:hypothetical protein [Aurantiacibacter marinus]KLI63038.1 hypothetical protein AAV99_12720 [Aurantiacibacter marinus]